jgi:predicted Zn-dependent peptidase
VPNDRLHVAFRLPVDPTREFLAAALALDALGALASSRLVRRLVRRERVANSVGAHAMGLVDGSSIGFLVIDVADGADPDVVEAAVAAELARFVEEGPTDAELEAALAQTERSYLTALAALDERADALSHSALLHGDPALVNTYLDRVAAIGADEIRAAAAAWLRPEHRVVLAHLATAAEDAA